MLGLAVALMCSGCMSTTIKPSIDSAKAGDGNVEFDKVHRDLMTRKTLVPFVDP